MGQAEQIRIVRRAYPIGTHLALDLIQTLAAHELLLGFLVILEYGLEMIRELL